MRVPKPCGLSLMGRCGWLAWALAVAPAILGVTTAGFAQPEKVAKEQVLTAQDLEKIKRRLDQITDNHKKLLAAIEEIKAELAIVKVRVTR